MTLKEDSKLVVMGKPGLEKREDLKKKFLRFLHYQKSFARNGKDSYYH